jgi:hypothetical protein
VGTTENVAKAMSVVEHQIRTLEEQQDSNLEGGQCRQLLMCPQHRIAVIIGKRGVTINAIQFVSGAKVQVGGHTHVAGRWSWRLFPAGAGGGPTGR